MTSVRTTKNASQSGGFTLIEIIVVLAVISLIITYGIPVIQTVTSQRINSTARRFTGMIRTIRNDSLFLNKIYRLAVDFDEQTWWVEEQQSFGLIKTVEEEEETEEEEAQSNFTFAEKYSKEPQPVPLGVAFDGVYTERNGLTREGLAYIHFFPNGYVDSAVLFLRKESSTRSNYGLKINPSTGRVEITDETVDDYL